MRRLLVMLVSALAMCTHAPHAAAQSGRSASDFSMSSARLDRVTEAFEARVASNEAAGYVIMIAQNGRVAYQRAIGVQALDTRAPMQMNTLFRIASMTKPVTAVAALTLIEQGRLSLSDPVKRYIPEIGAMKVREANGDLVDQKRDITIRDLMIHTSGIGYRFDTTTDVGQAYIAAAPFQNATSLSDAVKRISSAPLYFQPGERVFYSYGFEILGRVIEVVSGEPFDTYLRRVIFDPLGMRDTSFTIGPRDRTRLATVYQKQDNGALLAMPGDLFGNPFNPSTWPGGGAGLISTAPDYLRFAQMLLNGGALDGVQILSPASVRLMTSNHAPDAVRARLVGTPLDGMAMGLGVAVVEDVGKASGPAGVGDFAWGGHYDTQFFVSPAYNTIAIALSQRQPRPGETDPNTARLLKSLTLGALR